MVRWGGGVCVQTFLREFQKFSKGRPNSIIKHTGQARVPKETKGQKPSEIWNKKRGASEVKSKWGRVPEIAIKETSVPRVQFCGS